MKKIMILSTLLFVILSGVNAQTMEKGYFDYVQLSNPKKIQPFEWRMFPKPESIVKKRNKVIVVFDRKQWDAFHYMHRRMWMRRGEVHKRVEESKQK